MTDASLDAPPPQTTSPDPDIVPNHTGLSNDRLALRTLAEAVSDIVSATIIPARMTDEERSTKASQLYAAIADVFALTEDDDGDIADAVGDRDRGVDECNPDVLVRDAHESR
jgi:hypothetical protein